jgi:hypothetical protein
MHPFKMRLEHRTPMIQVRLLLLRPCCRSSSAAAVHSLPKLLSRQGTRCFPFKNNSIELFSRLSVCAALRSKKLRCLKLIFSFREKLKNHENMEQPMFEV